MGLITLFGLTKHNLAIGLSRNILSLLSLEILLIVLNQFIFFFGARRDKSFRQEMAEGIPIEGNEH